MPTIIKGQPTSAEIRDRLAAEGRPVLVAFSGGKDAIAAELALQDAGIETACTPWDGYIGPKGYGLAPQPKYGTRYAHRIAYMDAHGEIPSRIPLDHKCHTIAARAGDCDGGNTCPHRSCINPEHLEPVTVAENVRRGLRSYSSRELCRAGLHDITQPGATIKRGKSRSCRECQLASNRRSKARRRAKERARADQDNHS